MISSIFYKLKRIIVTLRFSILSIFVTLFFISMLSLIYINYKQSSRTLLFVANNTLAQAATSFDQDFTHEIKKAEEDSMLSTHLIDQQLINPDDQSSMIAYTLDLAYQFYLVQSVRWVDVKGNYIKAEYDTDETIMTEIIHNTTPPLLERIYRDEKLNIIKQETIGTPTFDPRTRPWYLQAIAAKKSVWTDIYRFQPSNLLGISLTTPIYSKTGALRGVLCLDIGLDWLSWYLGEQKISPNAILFIVTQDGKIVAHSKYYNRNKPFDVLDINHLETPLITESFNIHQKNKKDAFSFTYRHKDYLASYRNIPKFSDYGWTIGIVVPQDDFIGTLKKNSIINLFISLIILIFGIICVSLLVTRLIKPINKLVKEADKIRRLELGGQLKIKTNIKEILKLSNAIAAMKTGLQSFEKYIPATLVRQLVDAGENARIGGSKKPLVVLFSDIANFTKISENMDPNSLMVHICEYFDEFSRIIIKQKGTIDKYIGDSIMTFWGAPLHVNAPSIKAARAALQCKKRLIELNAKWEKENKPALETRFGMHVGDAIVGNVGSSQRLNYTALGDTINIASRLEGINKIYGTTIIVSDHLYNRIKKHFVFRKIDNIAVKGKIINHVIYELLAENKHELSFDIDEYNTIYEAAFHAYTQMHWEEAITLFKKCLDIFSEDKVAPVFIKRCQDFQNNPPSHWDGIWKFTL